MPTLEVCLSPALLHCYDVKDKTVIVVDVLRATSTMCAALHHGVSKIVPVATMEDCKAYKGYPDHILAAERDAKTAEGFDYSNSPHDYMNTENLDGESRSTLGKTLVLTTTNGTKMLHMVKDAKEVLIGAFVNVNALAIYLENSPNNILIACAAWKDRVNMEDSVFAGGLAHRLKNQFTMACDSGKMMEKLYVDIKDNLFEYHRHASHFDRLTGMGAARDLKYCLTENIAPVVPILKGSELVKI